MSNQRPEAILAELRRRARRTRRRYRPRWVLLVAFGALWLASLLPLGLARGDASSVYWVVGALVAYGVCGWYLWRARRFLGARAGLVQFAVLSAAVFVGIGLFSWLATRLGLPPVVGVGAAYVVLALVCWRSWRMAAVMAGLLATTVLTELSSDQPARWIPVAAYGLALLGYGGFLWVRA